MRDLGNRRVKYVANMTVSRREIPLIDFRLFPIFDTLRDTDNGGLSRSVPAHERAEFLWHGDELPLRNV